MILNRPGAEFEYEGVTYTIGGAVVGTAESEYEGLYGRITAIYDGKDKETENETPDIYCEFDPPVMPHEIKALEKTFSDLYDQPKTLDDIVLDMVIMAPEMIRPLDDLHTVRKKVPIYIVMEDWAVNGEHGNFWTSSGKNSIAAPSRNGRILALMLQIPLRIPTRGISRVTTWTITMRYRSCRSL